MWAIGKVPRLTAASVNLLYEQAIAGNQRSCEQLFSELGVSFRIFVRQRTLNALDGEEIVQDALTTIAEKFRAVKIETSFAAWAHKVLNNKLLDHYKGKRVRSDVMADSVDIEMSADAVSDPELKRRLMDCLKRIHGANSFHARALNLHYQGYSTAEICARLGVSANNFYVMLSRARTMLRVCLEKGEIES
jgi:RNA polymerase sigma factor (sigma-70 family)